MTSFCVQGGRGGQKGPKICVHTNSILPKPIFDLILDLGLGFYESVHVIFVGINNLANEQFETLTEYKSQFKN